MSLENLGLVNSILFLTCLVSILASFITLALCLTTKQIENLSRKLLLCFCFNNIGRCSMFIIGLYSKGYLCLIVGFMKNVFLISDVLLSFFIAKCLVRSLIDRKEIKAKEFYYWLIGSYIGIPAVEALAFTTNSYDGITCNGIKVDVTGVIWRAVLVYSPCTVLVVLILLMYCKIYKHLDQKHSVNKMEFCIDRGLIYSVQLSIIYLPLLFIRLFSIFYQNSITDNLLLAERIIGYLQGIFLLILTLLHKGIRESICCKPSDRNRLLSEGEYIADILN